MFTSVKAQAWTDEQYVNAIYKIEGGKHAKYLYGIKSIHYKNEKEARRICFTTIRHDRIRFKRYGYRSYSRFDEYLQSRYCPTKGRNFTQSEKRLNKYWLNNLRKTLNSLKMENVPTRRVLQAPTCLSVQLYKE